MGHSSLKKGCILGKAKTTAYNRPSILEHMVSGHMYSENWAVHAIVPLLCSWLKDAYSTVIGGRFLCVIIMSRWPISIRFTLVVVATPVNSPTNVEVHVA